MRTENENQTLIIEENSEKTQSTTIPNATKTHKQPRARYVKVDFILDLRAGYLFYLGHSLRSVQVAQSCCSAGWHKFEDYQFQSLVTYRLIIRVLSGICWVYFHTTLSFLVKQAPTFRIIEKLATIQKRMLLKNSICMN